jgi:hypothetical protein
MVVVHARRWFSVAALAFVGATLLAFGHAQEKPPAPAAPATIDERVALLEGVVTKQQEELARLARVTAGLTSGIEQLAAAAAKARTEGFEEAGANPASRVSLLAGIDELAATVKQASAPPAKEPAKKQ